MKRKTNEMSFGHAVFDIKKTVPSDMLETLGHIVIIWNAIEATLDNAIIFALHLPFPVWTAVRSRFSGLEAKCDIIKNCLSDVLNFDQADRALLADTIGDFMTIKGYRDNIAHVRLIMSGASTFRAFTNEKRGSRYELLFSKELLEGVLERLKLFRLEMFHLHDCIASRASANATTMTTEGAKIIENITRSHVEGLRATRKNRLALPSLPEFPVDAPIPPAVART